MSLPNFLCVGAQKAGTTSLHEILIKHPDIFLPRVQKEPHFFDDEQNYGLGTEFYELLNFAEADEQKMIGEITPTYMYLPEIPQRIRTTLGAGVRLIFCLRDPVKRAYSHYWQNYGWLWENETFLDAVALEPERLRRSGFHFRTFAYVARGRYFQQIQRFLEHFPFAQLHFMILEEDFHDRRVEAFDRLFRFLGVRPLEQVDAVHANRAQMAQVLLLEKNTAINVNTGGRTQRLVAPEGSILVNPDRLNRLRIIRRPSQSMRDFVNKHIRNRPEGPVDEQARAALYEEYFRKDVEQLESLLDRSLSVWKPGCERR